MSNSCHFILIILALQITNACGVKFSVEKKPQLNLRPTSSQEDQLIVLQNSYVHVPVGLVLQPNGETSTNDTDDGAFWDNFLANIGEKNIANFANSLNSATEAEEHKISSYVCRLKTGAQDQASSEKISIQYLNPCGGTKNFAWFNSIYEPNDLVQESYFTAAFAKLMEENLGNSTTLSKVMNENSFESTEVVAFNESNIVITHKGGVVFAYFQGSQLDSEDWTANMTVELLPLSWSGKPLGMAHKGYIKIIESVWPKILDSISKRTGINRYCFIGFSKGGALAMLAGLRYSLENKKPTSVFTFGQPRVGDTQFVGAFNAVDVLKIHRLVNSQDVVPHLPPLNESVKKFSFLFEL